MNYPFSLPPAPCLTERPFVPHPCNLPQYNPYSPPAPQLPTPCDYAQDKTVSCAEVCGDMRVQCGAKVAGTLSSFNTAHVDVLQTCTIECASTLTISAASLVFVSPTLSVGGPILASTVISPSTIVFQTPTVSTGTLNTHTLLTGTFSGITTLTTCTIVCPTTLLLNAPLVQASNNVTVATTLTACQISCPSSSLTITAPTTSMTGTLAATTLVSCTISCSASSTLSLQAPLVQAPGELIVDGTLTACQLVCSAFVLDAPTVALVGTLNVPTLNTCTISCSSTLTLQAPTVQVPGALTFPATLVACQVACPSSTLMLNSPTVVMTGTVQAATLASCAVTCPSTLTVLAPFVQATDDMVVPGTVSLCALACNATTLTLDASVTNMTGAVQTAALSACVVTCTSTPLAVLAPSAQAQQDMVVGGTLAACRLECDATTLAILAPTLSVPGTLQVPTLDICTVTCATTLALQAPLVQVPFVSSETLNTCQLGCNAATMTIMAPTVVMTGTIQIQTLDICTVSCATTLAIVTPTLQALGDLLVPSTLSACQIACPSSTLTVNAPVVMTGTIQIQTLDTCAISCPGTMNLLAPTIQMSDSLVAASLSACTIVSPCGVLELGAQAGVNAASQLQVDGTICVSTVFVCGSQSSLYVAGTLTVDQVQLTTNLQACTITCSVGTLQLPASGVSLAGHVLANGTVDTCRIKVATLSPCNSTVTVAGNLSFPNSIVNGVNVGGGPGLVFSTITTVDNFNMRTLVSTQSTSATIITSGNVVDMRLGPPLAVLPRTIRDMFHNGSVQSVAPNTWLSVAFLSLQFTNGYFGFPMTQPGTYFFASGFRVNIFPGAGVTRISSRIVPNSAGQVNNETWFMRTDYLQNPNPYTTGAILYTRNFKQLPKVPWPNPVVQVMFDGTTNTVVRNLTGTTATGDGYTFSNSLWRSTTALG